MTARGLSDGELQRLRYELGVNLLTVGAEPYIMHLRVMDIVQTYLLSDTQAAASCTTSVTTAGAVTLTLDDTTGMSVSTPVAVDVDDAYEICTVRKVTGSTNGTISVICQNLHTQPYPVEIESALTIVRQGLYRTRSLERQIFAAAGDAGIKQVDEVIFQDVKRWEDSSVGRLQQQLYTVRQSLASACNLESILASLGMARGGASSFSLY